jgi:hypothetical protein
MFLKIRFFFFFYIIFFFQRVLLEHVIKAKTEALKRKHEKNQNISLRNKVYFIEFEINVEMCY